MALLDGLVLVMLVWAAVSATAAPSLPLWPTHGVLYLLTLATCIRSAGEAGLPWRVVWAAVFLGPPGAAAMLERSLRGGTPTDKPAQE